jgi:hypothetical protein
MEFLALLLMLTTGADTRTLPAGVWGGPHARLTVRADGAALEFDCARGSVTGKIPLDTKGAFDVRGRYIPERGGPVRKGETQTGVPIRYRGTVRDTTLTLEPIGEDGAALGTYILTRGAAARLMKCR